MSNKQFLKVMINKRLSDAAEEIFALFEQVVVEYQREIDRLKNAQQTSTQASPAEAQWTQSEDNVVVVHCKEEMEPITISPEDNSEMLITNVKSLNSEGSEASGGGAESEEDGSESSSEDEYPDAQCSCSVCGKRFKKKRGVRMHMRMAHKGQEPLSPAHCDSPQDNNRVSHLTMGRSFSCAVCKRQFKKKATLEAHLRKHIEGDSFTCAACIISFQNQDDLICHINTAHSPESPFRCSVCNRKLKNTRNYVSHMLIHTGERPFRCSVCGRGFLQKGNLKYHMLTHSGEKPFSCSDCGAKYTSKQNLMHHRRANHLQPENSDWE